MPVFPKKQGERVALCAEVSLSEQKNEDHSAQRFLSQKGRYTRVLKGRSIPGVYKGGVYPECTREGIPRVYKGGGIPRVVLGERYTQGGT